MRDASLGTEVASWIGALVGPLISPKSDGGPGRDHAGAAIPQETGSVPLSLAARFGLAASIVLCTVVLLLGGWVANRIEQASLKNVGLSEALYVHSALDPLVPELVSGKPLSPESESRVHDFFVDSSVGRKLSSFKIARSDGEIVLASDASLKGSLLPLSEPLRAALEGEPTALISHKRQETGARAKHARAKQESPSLVRVIHVPLILDEGGSQRVAGVAIFEEDARALKARLDEDRTRTWLVVGISTLAVLLLLSGIVLKGSQTIEKLKTSLEGQIRGQTRLHDTNIMLRDKLQKANRRSIEFNERFLRRVGSDLHDGPAQSLALALLRLDELRPLAEARPEEERSRSLRALEIVHRATSGALTEIRNISAGLALPELQRISPADAIDMAIRMHERSTGTRVERSLAALPSRLSLPFTICIYRFVQEALNNAYRHANGAGQSVRADYNGEVVVVEVSDTGPGFVIEEALATSNDRLGLRGMRHRVEALGGLFEIRSEVGQGARLIVRFRSISTATNREAKSVVPDPHSSH